MIDITPPRGSLSEEEGRELTTAECSQATSLVPDTCHLPPNSSSQQRGEAEEGLFPIQFDVISTFQERSGELRDVQGGLPEK